VGPDRAAAGRRPGCRRGRLGALLVAALCLAASPALAHKLKVFATAVGARIDGEAYFVGGTPAVGARVIVEAPGQPPVTLGTDADGRFSFTAQARVDHVIIADSGDGHTARFRIAADTLPESLPAAAAGGGAPMAAGGPASAATTMAAGPASADAAAAGPVVDAVALRDIVAEAVASQVRPLREEINAYQDEVRLRDILGGLGFIVGLAGAVLWARAARRGEAGR
jgi:nickel transport protein